MSHFTCEKLRSREAEGPQMCGRVGSGAPSGLQPGSSLCSALSYRTSSMCGAAPTPCSSGSWTTTPSWRASCWASCFPRWAQGGELVAGVVGKLWVQIKWLVIRVQRKSKGWGEEGSCTSNLGSPWEGWRERASGNSFAYKALPSAPQALPPSVLCGRYYYHAILRRRH